MYQKINVHVSNHLDFANRINLGSFYTPGKYVHLVGKWLQTENIDNEWVIADLSCGGGAFFDLHHFFPSNKFVGNDIDGFAIECARQNFPFVKYFQKNAFFNVSRSSFEIGNREKLLIVGNPPYNDTTSIINNTIKHEAFEIDSDIKTRDLGITALLSYAKLNADYAAVLHPLSYLIKPANFNLGRGFFENYEIVNHIVFSSQEFANTSKTTGFPVIAVLYKKTLFNGLTYSQIKNFKFKTIEGNIFSLNDRDYIADYIDKYPHERRYNPEILFYTQRDINALKRGKTFMLERTSASVDVDPQKIPFYCYLDCFKRYANVPYFLGNFNVPFDKKTFETIKDDAVAIAKYFHQNIFGVNPQPTMQQINNVQTYINNVINYT